MATYAIGDIQGCSRTFFRLLERIEFLPGRDRLWLAGDLVNRGPDSLGVLRWAREHDEHLVTVLGNHDLHLLARAEGVRKAREGDTVDAVLEAPDRDELLDWLRARPFLHREGNRLLVHAGLLPAWSLDEAGALAADASTRLGEDGALATLFGRPRPDRWDRGLDATSRFRVAAATFTRLRTCTAEGRLCLEHSGAPENAPEGCLPWYRHPVPWQGTVTVFFGHWSQLGFRRLDGAWCLDNGVVWGRSLAAVRIEDGASFEEPYAESTPPAGPSSD
jgi:bis(5'-nucleosyl)-tetraphosphatase (symmetrical)